MRHWLLRFNHGVEIGARLAYLGHYERTKDPIVLAIADDELSHRKQIEMILTMHQMRKPSKVIDAFFFVVGHIIRMLCRISPLFLLDFIARTMEVFASFNYGGLARLYPDLATAFYDMSTTEDLHELYFTVDSATRVELDRIGAQAHMTRKQTYDEDFVGYRYNYSQESDGDYRKCLKSKIGADIIRYSPNRFKKKG